MTAEEYESLKKEAIKNMGQQMEKTLLQLLEFSSIKRKVMDRLIVEKGEITLFELEEELKKNSKKNNYEL